MSVLHPDVCLMFVNQIGKRSPGIRTVISGSQQKILGVGRIAARGTASHNTPAFTDRCVGEVFMEPLIPQIDICPVEVPCAAAVIRHSQYLQTAVILIVYSTVIRIFPLVQRMVFQDFELHSFRYPMR